MINAATLVLLAVLAQADAAADNTEAKARAQSLLKDGAKLYEQGALVPALDKFTQAYAEYKSPKLLFNIGQTSRDLGRLAEAMNAFEHFLAEATDAPAEMIAEAKQSVAELQNRLGKLRIQCATHDAEVSVDGKVVGMTPIPDMIWVMPGKHQVTARHPNTAPSIEDVEVNTGWVHTVVINLQPLAQLVEEAQIAKAPAPRAAEVHAPATESSKSSAAPEGGWLLGKKWAWVATGGAVVFTGSAVAFGLAMQSKFDSLNKSCGSLSGNDPPTCSQSDVDGVLLRRNLANISWGLAAAAAATAGVLFVVEDYRVAVAPMAGGTTGLVARMEY
jgi:hypothetical protein